MGISKSTPFRRACSRTLAAVVLKDKHVPSVPLRMLSKEPVHDFLYHTRWMDDAKKYVMKHSDASLFDLQEFIIKLSDQDPENAAWYNASLWMYDRCSHVKRAIYEDAAGLFFVKHDNLWKVVFPIDRFGSLISTRHELDPISGYFCPSLNDRSRPHRMW